MNNSDENTYDDDANNDTCDQSQLFIPDYWILYCQFTFAVVIAVFNVIVVSVFLRQTRRTSSTILLSFLAITDSLTSILANVPYLIGYAFHRQDFIPREDLQYGGWTWMELYSICTVSNFISILSQAFHTMSVITTVLLSLQKVVCLSFPFWSRLYLTNRLTVITAFCVAIVTIGFFLYIAVKSMDLFYKGQLNECCFDDNLDPQEIDGLQVGHKIFLLLSAGFVVLSTIYLVVKLSYTGRNIKKTQSKTMEMRRKRSAIIVVLICIVFIVSEMINFVQTLNSSRLMPEYDISIQTFSNSFRLLSWEIGFSVNFFVYFSMSQQLRNTLRHALCLKKESVPRQSTYTSKNANISGEPFHTQ